MTNGPVFSWSRLEFDQSVYCAVLRDPHIADLFFKDSFEPFHNIPSPSTKPNYLYKINTPGVPLTSRSSTAQLESPFIQQQLDNLRSQNKLVMKTLHKIFEKHTSLVQSFNQTLSSLAQ